MRNRTSIRRRSGSEGFTLLEMVVAVTLVAIIALALWAILRISISSWQRGTQFIDENQQHRAMLDLVEKQLASTFGVIAPLDLQGDGGLYPVFFGTDTAIQFVTLCPLRFREQPGLTLVSYEIVPGEEGDYSLIEREGRYLGVDPTQVVSLDQAGQTAITIFDHLTGAFFEYFDPGNGNDLPAQWLSAWDARGLGSLPSAISMTLTLKEADGGTRSRQIVFPVLAQPYDSRLNFQDPFEEQRRRPRADDPRTKR